MIFPLIRCVQVLEQEVVFFQQNIIFLIKASSGFCGIACSRVDIFNSFDVFIIEPPL